MQTELEGKPALTEAWQAYERGDFRTVRAIAGPSTDFRDQKTANAAADLLRRTGIDPAQVAVLISCTLFLAWTVWRYGQ